jgi:hypothetical protein
MKYFLKVPEILEITKSEKTERVAEGFSYKVHITSQVVMFISSEAKRGAYRTVG